MANILRSWFGFLMQSTTPAVSDAPQGKELVALSIKSDTLSYPFDSSREDIDYIQGTISACLTARATERGRLRFDVNDNALQKLLNKPNPIQSISEFIEQCSHFYDVTGQAVIYFIYEKNYPIEMWCLPSYYFVALFNDAKDPIPTAYRASDGRVIADTENLLIVKNMSVKTAPYIGRGFLGENLITAKIYDAILLSQKNYFDSGGAPNVAIIAPKDQFISEQQRLDVQKAWRQKYNPVTGVSSIAVIDNGLTVQNFGPQEVNYNTSKSDILDEIRVALQTPRIVLGDTDNVNYNNGQTALAMFERMVVLRWGQKLADSFQGYFDNFKPGTTVEINKKSIADFVVLPTRDGNQDLTPETQFEKEK